MKNQSKIVAMYANNNNAINRTQRKIVNMNGIAFNLVAFAP